MLLDEHAKITLEAMDAVAGLRSGVLSGIGRQGRPRLEVRTGRSMQGRLALAAKGCRIYSVMGAEQLAEIAPALKSDFKGYCFNRLSGRNKHAS